MKKTTLVFLFIALFCIAQAQKALVKKTPVATKQKATAITEVNPIVGSYKITRLANDYYDSDTMPNLDSINAIVTRKIIENRIAEGDTVSQADITEIEQNTKNDTKFAFSFVYEFKADKTYVFSYVDNDKPSESKGTYSYNAATGLITIMYPKKPNIFMKYNKENQTIQNVVKKKEDAGTIIIFSKVDKKTN